MKYILLTLTLTGCLMDQEPKVIHKDLWIAQDSAQVDSLTRVEYPEGAREYPDPMPPSPTVRNK
jgi:hypothetical protein